MNEYLMGIDIGTTGLRVCVYDAEGNNKGSSETPLSLNCPKKTWAEQSPLEWINALRKTVKAVMKENGLNKEDIKALATGTTCCSAVFCKKDGTLLKDCIMWMDLRAYKEADDIYEMTGERLSPEWMPCKLLWLKRNEPEIYEKAEVFCECQDYLTHYLTGIWSVNNNTACNWGYDIDKRSFPAWFYEKTGLSEALDKFPDDNVYRVGDRIGTLLPETAEELGLSVNTVVAQGGIDSSIGILGMGVFKPGRLALMTGSSNLTMLLTDKMMFSESTINAGPSHLIPGYYTSFRATLCSNAIIEWYRREMDDQGYEEDFFSKMEERIKDIPAGSNGLLLLDYFQGNKHPHLDSRARGMIYGLNINTKREEIYHCLLEGIAFGTKNLVKQYEDAGFKVDEINISGGTVNSPKFLQIMADVLNAKINVPSDKRSVALGCAIASGKAINIYSSLEEGVMKAVRYSKTITPIKENVIKYQALFKKYDELYPLLREWMHEYYEINL